MSMNSFSSTEGANTVAFPVTDVALFDALRIEQRLTAVVAGELVFTADTSPTHKVETIQYLSKMTQARQALLHWEGAKFFILFGYPTLFEDDAQQCAQLVWELHQFFNESPLVNSNRFALALDFTTIQQKPNAMSNKLLINGESLNQAIHLLGQNNTSGIWATNAFYFASQHEFEFETAVNQTTDNPIWQLTNKRLIPQEARGFNTLSSGLIGRDPSLNRMFTVAQNLDTGRGGIVIIEGEPGIGKSRLMREFVDALTLERKIIINGKCTPQRTHYPFSLFISLLANVFDIQLNDSAQTNRQKIREQTRYWSTELQPFVPYLYNLLGLSDEENRQNNLNPDQTRQQLFVAIRRIFKTLSQQSPIILLLDDLHWIDPISAELLLFLATTIATDPIFIICTQRRQGADSPNDRLVRLQSLLVGQTEKILLERLSDDETVALLQNLLGNTTIPQTFEQLIISKSEGNPYFIEEFVRMFIEQGHISQVNGRWQFPSEIDVDDEGVPISLTTLIQARIAALPPELKPTLEWAAILGLYFEHTMLALLLPDEPTQEYLERLSLRLMLQNFGNSGRWQFHHPLLHTAVYNAIPEPRQQQMHKQVAQALESSTLDDLPETAELLGYHLTQANEHERAIPYLIKAGQLALERHAGEEALNHLQRAAEFSEQLSDPQPAWYWAIVLGMGTAYRYLGRYAESATMLETSLRFIETNETFLEHQITILRELGDTSRKQGEVKAAANYYHTALNLLPDPQTEEELLKVTEIHIGLGWLYFSQTKLEKAEEESKKTLAYAQKTNHLASLASAENLLGGIAYRLGNWQEAMRHTTRAMIIREEMGDSWGIAASLGNLGILADESGFWDKAISYFQSNLALREEIGDIEGIIITNNSLGKMYQNKGRFDVASKHHRKGLEMAQLFNMPFLIGNPSVELASILIKQNKLAEAFDFIEQGKNIALSVEDNGLLIEIKIVEAKWLLAQSRFTEAIQISEKNLFEAQSIGNIIYEVNCWRIIAEAALLNETIDQSISAIRQAQNLIAGSTNALEKGITAALAFRIYNKLGMETEAESVFQEAETIFERLGASFFLDMLYASQEI